MQVGILNKHFASIFDCSNKARKNIPLIRSKVLKHFRQLSDWILQVLSCNLGSYFGPLKRDQLLEQSARCPAFGFRLTKGSVDLFCDASQVSPDVQQNSSHEIGVLSNGRNRYSLPGKWFLNRNEKVRFGFNVSQVFRNLFNFDFPN